MSSGNWYPGRSRCRCSRFSHAWMACGRSSLQTAFGGDKDLSAVVQNSFQLPMVVQSTQSSPSFQRQPPELLLQSLRSRNVALLDPSRSSLQIRVGDLSWRSAVSCFLHFSSPVSALHVLRRQSLLPSMFRFSSSGHCSFRTDLASDSSDPPIQCVISCLFHCGVSSFLDGSFVVLHEPLDVLPILVAIVPAVSADAPVPWSWPRFCEKLRYHESVRCFSRDLEPRRDHVNPCKSQDARTS